MEEVHYFIKYGTIDIGQEYHEILETLRDAQTRQTFNGVSKN